MVRFSVSLRFVVMRIAGRSADNVVNCHLATMIAKAKTLVVGLALVGGVFFRVAHV